jgi:hypothetical protein
MNRKRSGATVPDGDDPVEEEARTRQVNAGAWKPLPGMVKRRCPRCRYWFAVAAAETDPSPRCPDCAVRYSPRRG